MPANGQTLTFNEKIHAVPSQVYQAFTNASAIREWMCNVATVSPKPGGRVYLAWNEGFYACGEYLELKPPEKVVFSWHGRNEPGPTLVTVTLTTFDGGTQLVLEHSGIGSGEEWAKTLDNFREGWKSGLENLVSVLETGQDLRFTLRPMLGIGINDFDSEIARRLGVPVSKGIRIDNLIEGMGAQAAGLKSDDVIVSLGGMPVSEYADIPFALQSRRAGDETEVVFYRGSTRMTLHMQLSQRPLPNIPASPQGLAEHLHNRNEQLLSELMGFLSGVTEAEADFNPGNGDWNIKEILAHLIHGERSFQDYIPELISSQERLSEDYAGNLQARVEATVTVYPTLAEIVEEYRRSLFESEALIARLPIEVTAKKNSYWRLCYEALAIPLHFESHLDQMRAAAQAARENK